MKKFKQFNEGLTDKMTPKDDEEVLRKLKDKKASDRTMTIHRYRLSDDYLPTDKEWEEELDVLGAIDRLDFIRRFELADKFRPTDDEIIEDLGKLDGESQLNVIRNLKLSRKLIPDTNKVKKDIKDIIGDIYPYSTSFSALVDILFDNGYIYRGINIDKEGDWGRDYEKEKTEKKVIWFSYDKPHHFISFTDKTNLSELKDRINLYKKRYNL